MESKALKNFLFKPSPSHSKDIIAKYIDLLSIDIIGRNNNSDIINAELMCLVLNLPFYISTKLFSAIEINKRCSINLLLSYLMKLFTGTMHERIECFFKVLDFDKDGFIYGDDVLFFLQEFFLIKYEKKHLQKLKKILKSVKIGHYMNLEMFINYLIENNSDVFYLFLLFTQDANFFKQMYIEEYLLQSGNNGLKAQIEKINGLKNETSDSIILKEPSSKTVQFALETLGFENEIKLVDYSLDFEDDDNTELATLDDFEVSVKSSMSTISQVKRKSYISNDSLQRYKSMSAEPVTHILLERAPIVPYSCKDLSYLSMGLLAIGKQNIDYQTDLQEKGIKIKIITKNSNKGKSYITIKDKLMFIKSRQEKNSLNSSLTLIIILNHNYTGPITEHQSKNKHYYKTDLESNSSIWSTKITFYSTKKEKLEALVSLINNQTHFKNIFDYYTIDHLIAKGNFGEIYLSTCKLTNKKVAIKKIMKNTPESTFFWEKEIFTLLKNNSNPYVIKCIESFETVNDLYIVFEYLSFGNLRTFIQEENHELNETQRIRVINQMIQAMSYLHKKGIIHRDLKPDNIMIQYTNGSYLIKLTDFGLGKVLSPNEKTNESYGSLAYSAPEIIIGDSYSFQPDVWSIGMMIFFITTTLDPFDNVNVDVHQIKEMIVCNNLHSIFFNFPYDNERVLEVMRLCLQKKNRPRVTKLWID